jgi:hypothetical protein
MSAWIFWMVAVGVFFLLALHAPFPASGPFHTVLRLNMPAIGAGVYIMIDLAVRWMIFLGIGMERIYFRHNIQISNFMRRWCGFEIS